MALKATVYKAQLNVADVDRGYYADHSLTLALHPSETEERLMVRLLAFALYASERLEFCRGISTDDEPDLWEKDLTGDITLWIELGQPDESRVRKACNRARQVVLFTYGDRATTTWWKKNEDKLSRHENLVIRHIRDEDLEPLSRLAERSMIISACMQDGGVLLGTAQASLALQPENRFPT